jgi:hypothetical protein
MKWVTETSFHASLASGENVTCGNLLKIDKTEHLG